MTRPSPPGTGGAGEPSLWGESRHCRLVAHGHCASPSANPVGRQPVEGLWAASGDAPRSFARVQTHTGGRRIAACSALLATLALAPAAAAQSTGGATPVATSKPAAPKLSAPPPGVKLRPAPTVGSWRCLSDCVDARQVHTGSVLRVRGSRLGRTFEVKFLGAAGPQDDVATAPLERDRKRVDVRVPLGAVSGPIVLADRDDLGSDADRGAAGDPPAGRAAGDGRRAADRGADDRPPRLRRRGRARRGDLRRPRRVRRRP